MTRSRNELDRRIRRAEREAFYANVKGALVVLLPLALALGVIVYLRASPVREVGEVHGIAVAMTEHQSDDGRGPRMLAVELESGGRVSVALPRTELYRRGAPVTLVVREHVWPPPRVTYRFKHYAEPEPG